MEEINSAKILGLLSEKYKQPKWSFFCELRSGHTYHERTIDAFAISMHNPPGNGFSIAYEIKISRADYMNDIKNPKKREPFIKNSNEFYYVAPKGMIVPNEIPDECGLMELYSNSLKIKKIAQQRNLVNYSTEFVAALMRKNDGRQIQKWKVFKFAGKDITYQELIDYLNKTNKSHIEEIKEDAKRNAKYNFFQERKEIKELDEKDLYQFMKELCEKMGFNINYVARGIGQGFKYDYVLKEIGLLKGKNKFTTQDIEKIRKGVKLIQETNLM